jgi:hypothetical protein
VKNVAPQSLLLPGHARPGVISKCLRCKKTIILHDGPEQWWYHAQDADSGRNGYTCREEDL